MSEIDVAKYLLGRLSLLKSISMSALIDPPYEKSGSFQSKPKIPDEFLCKLCGRPQVDPRVLPCFHSFCFSCLRDWISGQFISQRTGDYPGVDQGDHDNGSSVGSYVSGYESDLPGDGSGRRRHAAHCPECGTIIKLPIGGLAALPPHYTLQHRILVASLNQKTVCLLCDLCSTEVPAVSRCSFCLLNLCLICSEAHKRQKLYSEHKMMNLLDSEGRAGQNVTAIRRQIMCTSHPDKEYTLYCTMCEQVVCRDCCLSVHRGHPCDLISRAASSYTALVREKLEKGKQVHREAKLSRDKLNVLSQRIEARCVQVESDINKFIESYIEAVKEHGKQLIAAVEEAKQTKLQVIENQHREITKSVSSSEQALKFGEQLFSEGSDTEVLSFASPLMLKLNSCLKITSSFSLPDLKVLETINFLPDEKSGIIFTKQMYGVVTTQRVSPAHSSLHPEGLALLNNARQQQSCEVLLTTRDSEGQPMCHGGEHVTADVKYRDLTRRAMPVSVLDRQDGSYNISFIPDSPGNMLLSICIRGVAVKGSPFPVCVRTLRAHHGTFHCCSFCSSGGRKDATCGCDGTMPGGYKGCGHGHSGHPGRRHWSCCGNVLHNSECGRPPPTLYHFSL